MCEGFEESRIEELCRQIAAILEAKREGAVKQEGPKTLDQVRGRSQMDCSSPKLTIADTGCPYEIASCNEPGTYGP